MAFVARQDASSATNTRLLVKFVTTTVFPDPTANAATFQDMGGSIPVAAIVGGVVAGMLLAILVTAGWVYWGKSIKRKSAKEQREAVRLRHHFPSSFY